MATVESLRKELDAFKESPEGFGYRLQLDLSYLIVTALNEKGWTQKELAKRAGLKESFISRIIHASNCTLDSAGRILCALGIPGSIVKEPTQSTTYEATEQPVFSFEAHSTHGEEETKHQKDATQTTAVVSCSR